VPVIGSRPAPARSVDPASVDARRAARADWLAFGLLALGLFVFFAELYPRRHWYFGVGPDGPVYLWWTRLAGFDGLSAVGTRPGIPALALALRGTIRSSVVEVLAAAAVAGAVSVGLAAAALVGLGTPERVGRSDRRLRLVAAGALAGTFAVHLADGYLANLIQAELFLAAAALLCTGTKPATIAAATILAASALTHPQFFALSAGILIVCALLTLLRRPPGVRWRDVEGTRILGAVLGGGALAGVGYASMLWGSKPLRVDTSEDAFLRRAGLGSVLRRQYRSRFSRHVARYVFWIQIPAAILGLFDLTGFLARFLGTWAVVLTVGVGVAVATALVPAVRLVAFSYVLPILAGIGLVRLWGWIARRSRVLAALITIGLGVGIIAGAQITWNNTQPYVAQKLLSRAATAGRVAASVVPPGTPLVFIVDTTDRNVAFLATRATNVIRDGVPPDRIRDVHVYVGSPEVYLQGRPSTRTGDGTFDRMSHLYLQDIRRAGSQPLAFVLAPANRPFFLLAKAHGDLVSKGVVILRPHPALGPAPTDTAPPPGATASSGWRLALFSAAALLVLFAIGFGWAAVAVRGPAALALAPAFGADGVILVGIVVDRLGAPLSGWGAPLASGLVAGGGYLTLFLRRRRELREEPHTASEALPELP
jgi:hypothetical protein